MSSDFAGTASLYNSPTFRARVRAAVVEHAAANAGEKPVGLVAAVLADPERADRQFTAMCADDAGVGDAGESALDDELRRVVAEKWSVVALSLGLA